MLSQAIKLSIRRSSVAIPLAIGFASSILIAWIAQLAYKNWQHGSTTQTQYWNRQLLTIEGLGVTEVGTMVGVEPAWVAQLPKGDPPSWTILASNPELAKEEEWAAGTLAVGIPLRSLKYAVVRDLSGAVPIVTAPRETRGQVLGLATSPIWWGLAANIVAHGAVIYAGVVSWRTGCSWRRLRRGCCANCGYELRGQRMDGCPECGEGRQS